MKRVVDLLGALTLLLLLAPLMGVVAAGVLLFLGRPVLFWQDRSGLNGSTYKMCKFRSMANAYSIDGSPLPDSERLSRFGQLLRASSLDELPELWNVLRGEMSLVGPRPLLIEYLPLYSAEQYRRHEVRPGITGWAQINGRNAISWEERFALDVWYVDNRTLLLDFKIMIVTLVKVLNFSGVSATEHVTMPKFRGTLRMTKQSQDKN